MMSGKQIFMTLENQTYQIAIEIMTASFLAWFTNIGPTFLVMKMLEAIEAESNAIQLTRAEG